MSMLKKGKNMVKLGVMLPLRQMTTYEQCMKVSAMLNLPTLNKQSQKGQGTQGFEGEECTMNAKKNF